MEEIWFCLISFSFVITIFFFLRELVPLRSKTLHKNLPPCPATIPIIGHLHLLKEPLHRTLQSLSVQYGPIFSLSLGSHKVLVLSSQSLVEECLTKNDLVFANRPRLLPGKYLSYNYTTIETTSYGSRYRNLRRIVASEITSTRQLNKFLGIRQEEVVSLVNNLFHNSGQCFTQVEMKSRLSELSFNIIMRMVAGKRYFGTDVEDLEEARKFRDIIGEIFEHGNPSYPGNFVPIFRWLDFRRYEKRLMRLGRIADEFLQILVDERRNASLGGGKDVTMVDSMLSLQEAEPENYSDVTIKGLIQALVLAGTDTSSVTIEWAMSLLLNHPATLKKAQAELDDYVGHERLVDEPDLPKLPFLQCIINETLRFFPPGPLLLPHESSKECTIGGFHVPSETMLLVNAWAVHRDPKSWSDPTSFRPERFEEIREGDDKGNKLIQFGLGRRVCPGAGLANRVVGLTLGALIQCFDWERVNEVQVDLSEGNGLTMTKVKPLQALCRARTNMVKVLAEL